LTADGDGHDAAKFHVTDDGEGDGFGSLTDCEVRALRSAHLAKFAVAGIGTAELTDEIYQLPPPARESLRRALKVRGNAPASTVAQSLRTMLARAPEDTTAHALLDVLQSGVANTSLTDELDEAELAALLRAESSELGFLSDSEILEGLLEEHELGCRSPLDPDRRLVVHGQQRVSWFGCRAGVARCRSAAGVERRPA